VLKAPSHVEVGDFFRNYVKGDEKSLSIIIKRLAEYQQKNIVLLSMVRRKDYRLYKYVKQHFPGIAHDMREAGFLLVDDISSPPPEKLKTYSIPIYNRLYYQSRKSACTVSELKEALGWQDEKLREIERLYKKGYTVRKIAAETGYSKSAVGRVVKKIKSAEKTSN
jgi:hypothetical protein